MLIVHVNIKYKASVSASVAILWYNTEKLNQTQQKQTCI